MGSVLFKRSHGSYVSSEESVTVTAPDGSKLSIHNTEVSQNGKVVQLKRGLDTYSSPSHPDGQRVLFSRHDEYDATKANKKGSVTPGNDSTGTVSRVLVPQHSPVPRRQRGSDREIASSTSHPLMIPYLTNDGEIQRDKNVINADTVIIEGECVVKEGKGKKKKRHKKTKNGLKEKENTQNL